MSYTPKFLAPAKSIYIVGDRGSGKTDMALWLSQLCLDTTEWDVFTNIYLDKTNDIDYNNRFIDLSHVNTGTNLLRKLALTNKKCVVIIDEAGIHASAKLSSSRENRNLGFMIDLIRKFHVLLMFITVHEDEAIKKIRDRYDLKITKLSLKKAMLYKGGRRRTRPSLMENIPKTDILYDTLSIAGWNFDIDMLLLSRALADYHSNEYREKIIEFLDNPEKIIEVTDRDFVKEFVRRANENGVKSPVALLYKLKLTPYTRTYLYEIARNNKR